MNGARESFSYVQLDIPSCCGCRNWIFQQDTFESFPQLSPKAKLWGCGERTFLSASLLSPKALSFSPRWAPRVNLPARIPPAEVSNIPLRKITQTLPLIYSLALHLSSFINLCVSACSWLNVSRTRISENCAVDRVNPCLPEQFGNFAVGIRGASRSMSSPGSQACNLLSGWLLHLCPRLV